MDILLSVHPILAFYEQSTDVRFFANGVAAAKLPIPLTSCAANIYDISIAAVISTDSFWFELSVQDPVVQIPAVCCAACV